MLIQKQNESWNLGSLANDCVPISFREPAYWRNKFSKIHRLKQRKGPNYPEHEYGNTSKQYYLVWIDLQVHNWRKSETFWSRRENQQSDVLNLFGRTATLTPEVEWCRVQTIPRALPFWNDVPVLLLNLSNTSNLRPLIQLERWIHQVWLGNGFTCIPKRISPEI